MDRRQFLTLIALSLFARKYLLSQDSKNYSIFEIIIQKAYEHKWDSLPIGELLCKVALEFIGYPYISNTLDNEPEEQCVVTFDGFDCVTFFEVSLCLARIIKKGKTNYEDLINEVTFTRYRNGTITDYTSRLHYSADWIYDNIRKKVIKDRTPELKGKAIQFNVNFMSENPNYYNALQRDNSLISKIKTIEQEISKRTYFVVPKKQINLIESKLKSGNIIFFATNKKGLDYSHVGICFIQDGLARLLHASSKYKKVILDKTIASYVVENKSITGITIVEPLEL